jgi:hypothetical protein
MRLGFAVGGLLLCVYLLTMGGHPASPDEEGMFYVAESIASNGSFSMPPDFVGTATAMQRGVGERSYSPSGIATSLMESPFVAVGQIARRQFPASYGPYLLRLSANLLDPILTALSGFVVFLLGRTLRYPARLSAALALIFGLATIAWPYSKYLWSEPVTGFWLLLSVLFLFRGRVTPRIIWIIVAGLCAGLSIASKIATGAALVGFLAYFMLSGLEEYKQNRRFAATARGVGAFGVGLLLVLVGIAFYNFSRFGNFLSTGYGNVPFDLFKYGGIAGLLISPGKSVFLYSPTAILAIPGIVAMSRRFVKEAVLILLVCSSQLLLYGSFVYWHGDAAWGPRYLVPITGLLVLPVGSLVLAARGPWRRRVQIILAVTIALGILVQIGGVLVNSDTYTISTGETDGKQADARRWVPGESPILAHWPLLYAHALAWRDALTNGGVMYGGFYSPEGKVDQEFPRWTDGAGTLVIRSTRSAPMDVDITYVDHRPPILGPNTIKVQVNGRPISSELVQLATSTDGLTPNLLHITIPTTLADDGIISMVIESMPWFPARFTNPADTRVLGIFVTELTVKQAGESLPLRRNPVAPLPISTNSPWSPQAFAWFYDPANAHLADVWEWYVSFMPIPVAAVRIAVGLIAVGAAASVWRLVASWRECVE